MSILFLFKSQCFIITLFLTLSPISNARRIDSSPNVNKVVSPDLIVDNFPSKSFSGDQLCPHYTVGNNSYNVTERAYNLKNITSRSAHFPWDIIPVYPYSDKSSTSQKCIFKRLWSKHSARSANSSFNHVNITLHSIFQRRTPANLHTGRKCTGFVKFLQIDIQDDIFRKTVKQNSENLPFSYGCILKVGKEIENSSVIQLQPKELALSYFSDRVQLKLQDSYGDYPVLVFVFMVQSATSCFLQVQQHWLLLSDEIKGCTKEIAKERLKRVCAHYDECSELKKVVETINGHYDGRLTYDYEDKFNDVETESEGFLDLPTIELFLKGLIFPTLILWAANLGYILLKRRMLRQNSTRSSVTSAAAPRYPDFPPPSYEHATCLPTYQEAMMSKTLCLDASSMTNSAKSDTVEVEINNKAASHSSLPDC